LYSCEKKKILASPVSDSQFSFTFLFVFKKLIIFICCLPHVMPWRLSLFSFIYLFDSSLFAKHSIIYYSVYITACGVMPHLISFVNKRYLVCHCLLLCFLSITMNQTFVLVLKSKKCIEAKQALIFSCKTWHQEYKFEVKSVQSPVYNTTKEKFPFTKFKTQIILMKKNRAAFPKSFVNLRSS